MVDINTPGQPPRKGFLGFFTTVDRIGPGKRECCADAFLRMVSDGPPGHPKSCLVAGSQCPFKLARPGQKASTAIEPLGIASDMGNTFMGSMSAKLIMIVVFLGGAIMIRIRLCRRKNAGGRCGGGAPPAPTAGSSDTAIGGRGLPSQDVQAMAWEIPYASLVPGSD